MLEIKPPARADFDSDAAWGHARALYFKNLPQRKRPEPQVIEVVREVPVEVIREVERIVEVERRVEVPAEPLEIEIPAFLRSDPVTEFIATEMRAGESMAEATDRLRLELEILLNRAKDGPLSEESEARKRELTSGLGRG
jgi:hypothetical protein